MIKVIDEVSGIGVKIKVGGRPYQYKVSLGKTGEHTIKRGRNAGQTSSDVQWGRPHFHRSFKQMLENITKMASEELDIPVGEVKIEGMEGWKAAVAEEAKLLSLIEKVGAEFQNLVFEYGKDLKKLSTFLAKQGVEEDEDEETPADDEEATVPADDHHDAPEN